MKHNEHELVLMTNFEPGSGPDCPSKLTSPGVAAYLDNSQHYDWFSEQALDGLMRNIKTHTMTEFAYREILCRSCT